MLPALSSLALRNGASTACLGNLCQCPTALIVKNLLYISPKSPLFQFKPSALVLPQQALLKRLQGTPAVSPSLDGRTDIDPTDISLLCQLLFARQRAHTDLCQCRVTAVTATSCPRLGPPGFKDRPEMGLQSRAEPMGPAWHQCRPLSATCSWAWGWGQAGRAGRGMQQNLRDEQGGWPSSSRHSLFSGTLSWCHH